MFKSREPKGTLSSRLSGTAYAEQLKEFAKKQEHISTLSSDDVTPAIYDHDLIRKRLIEAIILTMDRFGGELTPRKNNRNKDNEPFSQTDALRNLYITTLKRLAFETKWNAILTEGALGELRAKLSEVEGFNMGFVFWFRTVFFSIFPFSKPSDKTVFIEKVIGDVYIDMDDNETLFNSTISKLISPASRVEFSIIVHDNDWMVPLMLVSIHLTNNDLNQLIG